MKKALFKRWFITGCTLLVLMFFASSPFAFCAPLEGEASCLTAELPKLIPNSFGIERELTTKLNNWFKAHHHLPELRSKLKSEKLAAEILNVSEHMPVMAKMLDHDLEKLSHLLKGQQIKKTQISYDSFPLVERFLGEDSGKDLWSDRAQKTIHFHTQYLDQTQRKIHELKIKEGSLLTANGKLLDTSHAKLNALSNSEGRAMLVMDPKGHLYASTFQELGLFHHSSFMAGDPVSFAGEVVVKNGKIISVKNLSGHYLPSIDSFAHLLDRLSTAQVNLSEIHLEKWKQPLPKMGIVAGAHVNVGAKINSAFGVADKFMQEASAPEVLSDVFQKVNPLVLSHIQDAVTQIDHVGFIAPANTELQHLRSAAKLSGFVDRERTFPSVIVAKEIGNRLGVDAVPTQIFICGKNLDLGRKTAIEVFIPSAPTAQVDEMINEGMGSHIAFDVAKRSDLDTIKYELSHAGFTMPAFMQNQVMYNANQGTSTIYFDLIHDGKKMRVEFVHTGQPGVALNE